MSQTDRSARERSSEHTTFVVERTYDASPQRVFDAWADPAAKSQWFGPPDTPGRTHSMDFREGGSEHLAAPSSGGAKFFFDSVYQDIVPGRRIVHTYDMHRNDERISVSVATIEFEPAGAGTRLTLTEQGVYLDGLDTSSAREHGTNELMDALGSFLLAEQARA